MPLPLTRLVSELHRFAQPPASDAELLGRFVARRDDAAFQALVERHGPMVLRLCNRILGDAHAAEDAFQATFLVLARRASSLRQPAALAGWLYGVAQRVALKARPSRLRRCPAEPCDPAPDPLSALTARELLVVLEEELARLPEPHRLAVVLCCLEGHSRAEAAARLGCTLGALRGWLERGRARLHMRLVKRGVTLTAALAAAEVVWGSVTALPCNAASGEAVRLAAEVLRGGALLKVPVVLLLAIVLGAGALWLLPGAEPTRDEPKRASPRPDGKPALVDTQDDPLPPEAAARLGSGRWRVGDRLAALKYMPRARQIVVTTKGGEVQLWDALTGKRRLLATADLVVVPEIVCCHADNTVIKVFNGQVYQSFAVASGKELQRRVLFAKLFFAPACFSPDGASLVYAPRDEPIRVLDLATGKETARCQHQGTSSIGVANTPRGWLIAAAGANSPRVDLFDGATGALLSSLETPFENTIDQVQLTPDGKRVLCRVRVGDPAAVVMDVASGKELCRIRDKFHERGALSPDGRYAALGGDLEATVWSVETGKEVCRLRNRRGFCFLEFSADAKTLLAASIGGEISQWDIASGKPLAASADPIGGVAAVSFTDRGKYLVTHTDGYVAYDWRTGRVHRRYPGPPSRWARNLPRASDGSMLAALDAQGIALLDANTGQELRRITGVPKTKLDPCFSNDARLLIVWDNEQHELWTADVRTGVAQHRFQGHRQTPDVVDTSLDGRWLASLAYTPPEPPRTELLLWELASGKLLHRITFTNMYTTGPVFSPNGDEVVIAEHTQQRGLPAAYLRVIHTQTGQIRRSFAAQRVPTNMLFAPDGRTLAVTEWDEGSLCLYEWATGQVRHYFANHRCSDTDLVYSDDGALLAASTLDGRTYVWDVYGKHGKPAAPQHWSNAAQNQLWQQLAGADAKAAFQTIRRLIRQPTAALALLRQQLKPAAAVAAKQLQSALTDLDSADFETRQAASAELQQLGDRIEAPLRQALANKPNLEAKRRLETLLAKFETPTPERLARGRALEALEQIATPAALRLLETLASGDPAARLTREANLVCERLRRVAAAALQNRDGGGH